jgi:hypothetical protein
LFHQGNARRRRACLVFFDESGVILLPNVRRTWARRGQPPVLRHRFNWKRASMAAALCYGVGGGGAQLCFHVQAGNYDTDCLIGVLKEVRRFLGGQKATLLWDGLGAHRSRAMQAFLVTQRDWLVVERLPAYAPDLNPVEGLWSNLKGQERGLRADKAGAAHDQPVGAEGDLGHLRDAAVGVVDVDPGGLGDGGDRSGDRLGLPYGDRERDAVAAAGGQDLGRPERRVGPQGQLAAGTGPADAPGQLVDKPLGAAARGGPAGPLPGVQHLAAVGPGGQQRVVAEPAGVAVGRATLVVAVDLADGGVQVEVSDASPGPAPAAHALARMASATRSSCRTCPKVNERRNVPMVEGAMT